MPQWILTDDATLVYGSDMFKDHESSIRALTFGAMLELADGKIQNYHSDMFHDALWISEKVNGPIEFEWCVRESGTHIAESATHIREKGLFTFEQCDYYRLHIVFNDGKWKLQVWKWDDNEDSLLPYFSTEPLPETVLEAVAEMEPTLIKSLVEDPEIQDWSTRHGALDVEDCDYAKTVAGCVYHPAPMYGWPPATCTGYMAGVDLIHHDGDTCPVHEYVGTRHWENSHVSEQSFPAPRNNQTKENRVDSLLDDLRTKLDEANSAKEELDDARSELDDKIDELDTYISEVDDLLNSLERLPEVSVYFSLDVSFDS